MDVPGHVFSNDTLCSIGVQPDLIDLLRVTLQLQTKNASTSDLSASDERVVSRIFYGQSMFLPGWCLYLSKRFVRFP